MLYHAEHKEMDRLLMGSQASNKPGNGRLVANSLSVPCAISVFAPLQHKVKGEKVG